MCFEKKCVIVFIIIKKQQDLICRRFGKVQNFKKIAFKHFFVMESLQCIIWRKYVWRPYWYQHHSKNGLVLTKLQFDVFDLTEKGPCPPSIQDLNHARVAITQNQRLITRATDGKTSAWSVQQGISSPSTVR